MPRTETVELTVMCMVYDHEGNILVQDRKKRNWPGINFPGGHVEPDESFVDAVVREVREETGLFIENPRICGTKQFKIRGTGDRFICIFYKTDKFSGELASSDEGEVFWIKRSDLENYVLADGFGDMVKIFEREDLSEIYYGRKDGELFCEMK